MLHLSTFGISLKTQNMTFINWIKIQKIIESIKFCLATAENSKNHWINRFCSCNASSCTLPTFLLHGSPPDKFLFKIPQLRYRLNIWPVPWSELETNILGFDKDKDEASTWISCRAPWWEACETWASTSRRWGSWSRSSTTGRTCLNRTSLEIWSTECFTKQEICRLWSRLP